MASLDLEQAVDYYTASGGTKIALAFLDEFDSRRAIISSHPSLGVVFREPSTGESRVRRIRFRRFPWSLLYFIDNQHLIILRVVHESRDLFEIVSEIQLR